MACYTFHAGLTIRMGASDDVLMLALKTTLHDYVCGRMGARMLWS